MSGTPATPNLTVAARQMAQLQQRLRYLEYQLNKTPLRMGPPSLPKSVRMDDYLKAWWLFNGDYQDSSGNDHDLTNINGSIVDNTYKVEGSQYADAGAKLIPATGDFTVTGWFDTEDASDQIIWSQGQPPTAACIYLMLSSGASYKLALGLSGVWSLSSTETNLNDDARHFVAIRRIGDEFDMFLDGVHTGEQKIYAEGIAQTLNFRIARLGEAAGYDFKGYLDDIRIYKKGLTDWEIRRVHEEGLRWEFEVPDDVHKAFCKNDAGAATAIDCYLDAYETGEVIAVNVSIMGPGGTKLNAASPRLEIGNLIFVKKYGSEWWCTTFIQADEACICYSV